MIPLFIFSIYQCLEAGSTIQLYAAALRDTLTIQQVLSEESLSLRLRHIASNLFNSCSVAVIESTCSSSGLISSKFPSDPSSGSFGVKCQSEATKGSSKSSPAVDLLHEVILTIGYTALLNQDNQSGRGC